MVLVLGPVCLVFFLSTTTLEFSWSAENALDSTAYALFIIQAPGRRGTRQHLVQLCGAPGRRDGTKQQM